MTYFTWSVKDIITILFLQFWRHKAYCYCTCGNRTSITRHMGIQSINIHYVKLYSECTHNHCSNCAVYV